MAFDFDYFKFQPNHRAWGGLVKTWLDRSQACALSLQIVSTVKYDYGAIKYDDGELYAILELMEAAAAHCARWEYLKFHLAQASRIHMFKLDGSRPLLRHLDMRLEYDSRGRSDVSGFRDTPFLCTAVLNGNVIARGIILPWMQLASLVLQRIRPSRCSHILKQAPNLIHSGSLDFQLSARVRLRDPISPLFRRSQSSAPPNPGTVSWAKPIQRPGIIYL